MQELIIGDEKIKKGVTKTVELQVARLPSGTPIHLPVYVYRSRHDGPVLMLSGGLHGDEVNGIEVVRKLITSKVFEKILCGSVVALPIINLYGFLNFSREVPDGKDVNRSFPGNADGSLASLVAWNLTNRILPSIDLGIDFHTGGASRTNYPQVRFAKENPLAEELATAFAAPFLLHTSIIEGSLRGQAQKMGKTIVVYEGGESLRFDEHSIEEAIKGVKRVMKHLGMVRTAPPPPKERIVCYKSTWERADSSGLFRAIKKSGQYVKVGELLGHISDPFNQYEVDIESETEGYIIGHNNNPVVMRGDALFHIGVQRKEKPV